MIIRAKKDGGYSVSLESYSAYGMCFDCHKFKCNAGCMEFYNEAAELFRVVRVEKEVIINELK
jgi:hypothetical protein